MREGFVKDLRRALNHLYDPDFLGSSPLCSIFGLTGSDHRAIRLQRILEEAIAAGKPKTREPATSRQWHTYQLLAYRYLQQFSQRQVARQLNISVGQLAREQNAALQALALQIWERQGLVGDALMAAVSPSEATDSRSEPAALPNDLAWLAVPSAERVAEVSHTLRDVAAMMQPLFARYGAALEMDVPANLPALAVYPSALRQMLLNLLTDAAHGAQGGRVAVSAAEADWLVTLRILAVTERRAQLARADVAAPTLNSTQQLAALSGGSLVVTTEGASSTALLSLPSVERTPVLVVDDSRDHIRLLQRYVAGTRYRLFATEDPEQAVAMVEQTGARVVVLDIMMPKSDGWTVVQRLRSHPVAAGVPIVVCSIVPCEELALSLGADAFLPKPLTQERFLAMLACWTRPAAPAPP